VTTYSVLKFIKYLVTYFILKLFVTTYSVLKFIKYLVTYFVLKLVGGGWSLPELPAAYNFAASTAVGGPSLVQGTRTSQVYIRHGL